MPSFISSYFSLIHIVPLNAQCSDISIFPVESSAEYGTCELGVYYGCIFLGLQAHSYYSELQGDTIYPS